MDGNCTGDELTPDGTCIWDAQDDEMTSATPAQNGKGSGIIGPDTDVDWWSFEVTEPGWWELNTVSSLDKDFDPVYTFYAPDGQVWYQPIAPQNDVFYLYSAGTWRFQISDAGNGGDEDFDYAFDLEPDTGISTVEPDDTTPNLLVELGQSTDLRFTYSGPEDVDRVAIHIPENDNTHIQWLAVRSWGYMEQQDSGPVQLLDMAGTPLASIEINSSVELLSGDYILEIATGAYGNDLLFNLDSNFNDSLPEDDFNDTQEWAGTAAYFNGRILMESDEDWWFVPGSDWDFPEPVALSCSAPIGSTLQDLHIDMKDSTGAIQCTGSWSLQCNSQQAHEGLFVRLTSSTPGEQAWYICWASWPDHTQGGGD